MAYVQDRWKTGDRAGKGRRWRVRYVDPGGRERSRSFDRKADADRFMVTAGADILRGTWVDPKAGRITLRSYAEGWLAMQTFEESTRERVEQRLSTHILPAFGDQYLGQIAQRPSAIQAWLKGMAVSETYKRALLTHLSSCLNAAVDDGLISRNPCKAGSIRAPKVTRVRLIPWTAEQVAAVRAELPERYRALSDVGAALGLRQGEALGFSPQDADWLRGTVHIRRQVRIVRGQACFAPPKGDRERDIPLPESVKLRLSAHLAAWPAVPVTLPWKQPGGKPVTVALMFTTGARHAINRSYIDSHLWIPARRRAGLPDGRRNGFHALRHFFASSMLARGLDIRTLAEYLGHSDPGFTLRVYAHFIPGSDDRMRKIADDLLLGAPGPETAPAESETHQGRSGRGV